MLGLPRNFLVAVQDDEESKSHEPKDRDRERTHQAQALHRDQVGIGEVGVSNGRHTFQSLPRTKSCIFEFDLFRSCLPTGAMNFALPKVGLAKLSLRERHFGQVN